MILSFDSLPLPRATLLGVERPAPRLLTRGARLVSGGHPDNVGLRMVGRPGVTDLQRFTKSYESKLQRTPYPHLYLELHPAGPDSNQIIWDTLSGQLQFLRDFPRIALVVDALWPPLDLGDFAPPGVVIRCFTHQQRAAARRWLA